jgi:hypothetical protein
MARRADSASACASVPRGAEERRGKRSFAERRRQMANSRKVVRLCAKARVTGVAFFDFQHGQTGVAPNAIELHPILDFVCLLD